MPELSARWAVLSMPRGADSIAAARTAVLAWPSGSRGRRTATSSARRRHSGGSEWRGLAKPLAMKIAIDARKWRDYGIGTYVRNLVRHLAHLDRETTYFLFCDRADEATLRDLAE